MEQQRWNEELLEQILNAHPAIARKMWASLDTFCAWLSSTNISAEGRQLPPLAGIMPAPFDSCELVRIGLKGRE
ncbi:MAG: hypothetical protein ACTHN5_14570 [Phycisphaerae bacterium]